MPEAPRAQTSDKLPQSKLPPGIESMSGPQMYQAICSPCHGTSGDGNGPATQYLWPPPRNFRRDKFRLVNTKNRVPTRAVIMELIEKGMPGTSMTSFEELDSRQRELLAEEVLRFRCEGLRQRAIKQFREDGSPTREAEVEAVVRHATTPGEAVVVPMMEPADPEAIARGKRLYRKQSCQACHGNDGVGAWDVYLRNDEGDATRPRDLAHEQFKGGNQPESIYLRLRLGMPGTPHPSSPSLSEKETVDLVHYCRSLSKEPKLNLTGHQRRSRATSRNYLKALGSAESP